VLRRVTQAMELIAPTATVRHEELPPCKRHASSSRTCEEWSYRIEPAGTVRCLSCCSAELTMQYRSERIGRQFPTSQNSAPIGPRSFLVGRLTVAVAGVVTARTASGRGSGPPWPSSARDQSAAAAATVDVVCEAHSR